MYILKWSFLYIFRLKIEKLYIPTANLLYELGKYEVTIFYLEQGIQIGLEHKNVKSYIRLEQELKYYISEIKQEF